MPEDWRKANVIPTFKKGKKDPGHYRLVNLSLVPGKVMEQLILKTISRHMKDKNDVKSSQHGFTDGKSCSTTLITLYDKMTGLVEKQWMLST